MESVTKPLNQPLGLQRLSELCCLEVNSSRTWTGTKYEFSECSGELLFSAKEKRRGWFSLGLGFNISLLDANDVEVITLKKPSTFCASNVEIRVQGALVSLVRQKSTCLKPIFKIKDENEVPVYRIKGPWNQSSNFELTTMHKEPLGAIIKRWGGWRKELMSTRDDFTIAFPQDLEIKYKAACIAVCVSIILMRRRRRNR